MSAMGPGCVKTPTYRVFMGTKMSPRATIVDSRAFYKADVSIELSKIEFSHSLGREPTLANARYRPRAVIRLASALGARYRFVLGVLECHAQQANLIFK